MRVDEDTMYSTILYLQNNGKLPQEGLGMESYDFMCEEFKREFEDTRYTMEDWEKAKKKYLADEEIEHISALMFHETLKKIGAVEEEYTEEEKAIYAKKQRTNSRMFKSYSRVLDIGLDIEKYLPSNGEAMGVGTKHGFSANELLTPHKQGGQFLAIKQFIAEYRAFTAKGKPFPYVMGVDENKEIVWKKAEVKKS